MCEATIAAIIGGATGGVFGVIGAIVGAYLGSRKAAKISLESIKASNKNAVALVEVQEFRKASGIFLSAFVKEQRILSSAVADKAGDHWNANEIVSRSIARHEHAMIRFRPFVRESDISSYDKTWYEYAGDSRHFEKYIPKGSLDRPVKWSLALTNITNLLEFAKYKHQNTSIGKPTQPTA